MNSIADELLSQFADSAPPEGATTPPPVTPPVETPPVETPDATTTPPIDPSLLKHGARIGELMVINPNEDLDITQLRSAQKLQRRLTETEKRLAELEQTKAADTRATEEKSRKDKLNRDLAAAKDEKGRVAALLEYKNWEQSRLATELEDYKNQQAQQADLAEIDEVVSAWDDYYESEGYDPEFLMAVNRRAYVQSQGNPVAYQNIRQTVIADFTARAARGLIRSPFRADAIKTAEGTGTTETPAAQVAAQVLGAVAPTGANAGQPDLMDMFFNSDMDGLKSALNIRR